MINIKEYLNKVEFGRKYESIEEVGIIDLNKIKDIKEEEREINGKKVVRYVWEMEDGKLIRVPKTVMQQLKQLYQSYYQINKIKVTSEGTGINKKYFVLVIDGVVLEKVE